MVFTRRELKCRRFGDEAKITRIYEDVVFVYCPRCEVGQSVNPNVEEMSEVLKETLKTIMDRLPINRQYELTLGPTGGPRLNLDEHFRVH